MSRLDWQIGGDSERGMGAPRLNEFMRAPVSDPEPVQRRAGNLEGFFGEQNVAQGWQQERRRALRPDDARRPVGYDAQSMTEQFRATRGLTHGSESFAKLEESATVTKSADDEFWGVGDHPTWGRTAAQVFSGQRPPLHPGPATRAVMNQPVPDPAAVYGAVETRRWA